MMDILFNIVLALGLSVSGYSTALHTAVYRCLNWKENLVMAFLMSFFHILMIYLGWITGKVFSAYLGDYRYLVAVFIFIFVGIRIFSDYKKQNPVIKTLARFEIRMHLGFA